MVRLRDFSDAAAIDTVVSPYTPRTLQAAMHRDGHRYRLGVAHRRFGKSYFCAGEILERGLSLKRKNMELAPPRYAFIAPTSDMAKDLGFEPMIRFLGNWPHTVKRTKPYEIRFPSAVVPDTEVTVQFIGAFTIDKYRGRYLDGAVIDEFSEMPGSVWKAVIYPQLADYIGWAIVIGTPKGRNAFYQLFQDARTKPHSWGVHYYPASMTDYVDAQELLDQREELGEDLYNQEFELEWMAAVVGAYYGKLLNTAQHEGRITQVPHDPDLTVNTAWDLGIADQMVVWWYQQAHGEIRIIDYHQEEGQSLSDAISMVKERKSRAGRLYTYRQHCFPHDLAARDLYEGKSREESAIRDLRGFGHVRVMERRKVEDGIDQVRRVLPQCWFDAGKCSDGIDMLSLYRVKKDEKLDTNTKPIKDITSHAADAFRTLAQAISSGTLKVKNRQDDTEGADVLDEDAPMDELMKNYGNAGDLYPGTLGGVDEYNDR